MSAAPKFVYRIRWKPTGDTYGPQSHAFYTVRGVPKNKIDNYNKDGKDRYELVTYQVVELKEVIPDDVQGY